MKTAKSNPLVNLYSNRIGQPSTADEAFGYWVLIDWLIRPAETVPRE
jgi:hypothetical protein